MDITEKIKMLPQKSGVYIFKDEFERIIYIGKANNLRNRVRQYFTAHDKNEGGRRQLLRNFIKDVDYIVVNSSMEALILEANLIKKHRPSFNVRMKDDKAYPSLEITFGENFPRLKITRRSRNKKSRYFGPYTRPGMMRKTFKLVQKAFKIRTCKYDLTHPLDRPCLDYHINLCPAPCVRYITEKEYKTMCNRASRFLDGKAEDMLKGLKLELEECSRKLEFEKCILVRDLIESIEYVIQNRPVISKPGDDADFIGIAHGKKMAVVSVIELRNGKILKNDNYKMDIPLENDPAEVIQSFFQNHYQAGYFVPPKIFIPIEIEGKEEIEQWLSGIRERKVKLKVPRKGQRKKMLDIALKNAEEALIMEEKMAIQRLEMNRDALADLQNILGLKELPLRIEGFDVSNISGKLATASMVVFREGEPFKSHYRKFKIRHLEGPDDFAMMNETITRRFKNLKLAELESFKEKPDLILVDGGKGQLKAALQAARAEEINQINMIGLAKKEEEVFLPGIPAPLNTDPNSPGMKLLRRIRDEAHRFAVTYHRKLRRKQLDTSLLEQIPGISRRRKETLLKHFDTIEDIARASLYDLQELPGFNRKIAENVISFLKDG
ncbi:MAG: excinuclease ABC subunit UvrC [Vulcanimicrobiota bacterium]